MNDPIERDKTVAALLKTHKSRQSLRWALQYANRETWVGNDGLRQMMRLMRREEGPAEFDALHAVVDHNKLAALLRLEGMCFGWTISSSPTDEAPRQIYADEDGLVSVVWPRHARRYTLAEARVILRKWLDTSGADDAERALFEA